MTEILVTTTLKSIATAATSIVQATVEAETYTSYVLRLPFIVISIPYYVYYILTYTLTLTLDIYSLSTLFVILASVAYYVFRFKYLAKYARLPPNTAPHAGPTFDLHPNTTLPPENESQEDYMDMFLASIKVFGYLDRPIFHELSRQMDFKKLDTGVVLYDENNRTRDFIVVVEGTVDLYIKRAAGSMEMDNDEVGIPEGYMLLHRVKSGGAVSSLFGIISVLTDNLVNNESIIEVTDPNTGEEITIQDESDPLDTKPPPIKMKTKVPFNIHPNIIAKTSSAVTLAYIPAEAFEALSKKHPHTAAHFAQVIITRFQRVTFSTLYRYLGLSRELLQIEQRVNELSTQGEMNYTQHLLGDEEDLKSVCFDHVSELIGMDCKISYSPVSMNDVREERQWCEDVLIQTFEEREIVLKEGERVDGIYYVLGGELQAYVFDKKTESNRNLFVVGKGRLAGYVANLTGQSDNNLYLIRGYPSFISLSAKTKVQLAFFPKTMIEKMVERCPAILLTLALRLMTNVSPLVLQIDLALEWVQVSAGQVLYRQGDEADSIHYVLSGRLRCINEPDQQQTYIPKKVQKRKPKQDSFEHAFGSPISSESNSPLLGTPDILVLPPTYESAFEILSEHGQNDSIGEHQALTSQTRPGTLYAIRESELGVMSKTLFEALAALNPTITLQISRIIANRTPRAALPQPLYNVGLLNGVSCHDNLKTVAIIPTHGYVPVGEFGERLGRAVGLVGDNVVVLDTGTVMNALGKHAFTRLGRLKLNSWLAEQEDSARIVLYVADGGLNNPWTVRCVRQADLILFVGLGEESGLGEFEQLVMSMKTTARKELVLIYPNRGTGRSATWLKERPWITMHHHICMRVVKVTRNGTIGDLKHLKVVGEGLRSDFARLARRLLNKSIGLVLGGNEYVTEHEFKGGGARGFAHAGIIRALDEAGIPIDMVGGTSMGAFVGGIYARENDSVNVYGRCKMFANSITYPYTAMFYGHEFNRGIWKGFEQNIVFKDIVFGDTHIEDCWIPFFCNTTNITFQRMEIHRFGYMWRFVRASMSLAGYLPPLCENGNLLVDGGYLNNLPADIMLGAKTIITVDVGLTEDTSPVNYGDTLSGWTILFQKMNPFSRFFGPNTARIPPMAEIQSRLAYISSVKQLLDAKSMDGVLCMRPAVLGYGTMEFSAFKNIYEAGYTSAKEIIEGWQDDKIFQSHFGIPSENDEWKKRRRSI